MTPFGDFPWGRVFEGVVRFEVLEEEEEEADHDIYRLRSNNYHSTGALHKLHITVNRRTDQLEIVHWHPLREIGNIGTTYGVITPFGIVSFLRSAGAWMWLWKKSWSG